MLIIVNNSISHELAWNLAFFKRIYMIHLFLLTVLVNNPGVYLLLLFKMCIFLFMYYWFYYDLKTSFNYNLFLHKYNFVDWYINIYISINFIYILYISFFSEMIYMKYIYVVKYIHIWKHIWYIWKYVSHETYI